MDITITSKSGKHVDKGSFHVELLDNKFLTPASAGAALMNAINYYLPDRDDVTAKVESTVRLKGAAPIQFTDYLYANDGAASVMGAVRYLRGHVPLLMNPYAPVTIEKVEIKVDLKFEANFGDIKEIRLPAGDRVPGKRNTVQVMMSTWDGKDVVEDVPVDVPQSLAGSIVNLGSIPAMVGANFFLYEGTNIGTIPDYFFHKGGMLNLTRYLAALWGPAGVRVNCVSPGGFYNNHDPVFVKRYSQMTMLGRMANQTDLGGAIVFLLSEASSYITGANLPVDGGYTAK